MLEIPFHDIELLSSAKLDRAEDWNESRGEASIFCHPLLTDGSSNLAKQTQMCLEMTSSSGGGLVMAVPSFLPSFLPSTELTDKERLSWLS